MSDAITIDQGLGKPHFAGAMVRHPWRWFFAIALLPTVVVVQGRMWRKPEREPGPAFARPATP
jgi:hypothetical protein